MRAPGAGGRPAPVSAETADRGATKRAGRAVLAMEQAQPCGCWADRGDFHGDGSRNGRQCLARHAHRAAEKAALASAQAEKLSRKEAEERDAETRAVLAFVENKVFDAARPKEQEGGVKRDVTLREAIESSPPNIGASFHPASDRGPPAGHAGKVLPPAGGRRARTPAVRGRLEHSTPSSVVRTTPIRSRA